MAQSLASSRPEKGSVSVGVVTTNPVVLLAISEFLPSKMILANPNEVSRILYVQREHRVSHGLS
jgi:hypothetical protein